MSTPNDDLTAGVGQAQSTHETIEKYDSAHGKYQNNVSPGTHLPNESPAGTDPSPFRIGPTK